jgi:fructokinase
MGHITVERLDGDEFPGVCPYHGDCFEGMACGPSLERRWGRKGQQLGELYDEAVEVEAHYVAAGIRNLVYTLAPERVIVGGGVGQMPGLVERVNEKLVEMMAGYATQPEHEEAFVVRPALGDDAGIAGGFVLAEQAAGGRGGGHG